MRIRMLGGFVDSFKLEEHYLILPEASHNFYNKKNIKLMLDEKY